MKVFLLILFWTISTVVLDEQNLPNSYPTDLLAASFVMGISYLALSRHMNSSIDEYLGTIAQIAINLSALFYIFALSISLSPTKESDGYAGVAFLIFYAIYFFSFRLNNIDNAAALRHNKEKEKKERDIEEEEQNKLERQKNKLQRKKNLQLENIRIAKSIELLELKLERVTNKKNAINNQITSLEEKIRSEKLSFDTLKGKYPFLSKATIVHNR
tara:strand:- start:217 stop:861 length:645 start_codon:yes stop_codon:yes gene_type:complete